MLGGFLSGMLGIGGGVVYVFVLTQAHHYHYGEAQDLGRFVIANSLFVIFFSSLSSTLLFKKEKLFYPKETLTIGVPSICLLFLLTIGIVSQPFFSAKLFNAINLAVLIYILYTSVKRLKQSIQHTKVQQISIKTYIISGVLSGTMAALTGLGGGTILNPILNGRCKLPLTTTRSISLGVIMLSSFAITIFNISVNTKLAYGSYTLGYINFSFCIPLAIGSLLCSPLGVKTGNKLKASQVMMLFSIFILLMIIKKAMTFL